MRRGRGERARAQCYAASGATRSPGEALGIRAKAGMTRRRDGSLRSRRQWTKVKMVRRAGRIQVIAVTVGIAPA